MSPGAPGSPRASSTASPASSSASSIPAGSLPPAVTTSPLPPPPPPTALASFVDQGSGLEGRAGRDGSGERHPTGCGLAGEDDNVDVRRVADGDRQLVELIRRQPVDRRTTAPSTALPARSSARLRASLARNCLFSSLRARSSSSLRCTPPVASPGLPTKPAISPSRRSLRCSRATAPVPVTASIRRRFEPIDPSLTILIVPMSPVALTCVPPQKSTQLPAAAPVAAFDSRGGLCRLQPRRLLEPLFALHGLL